ncbi:hypothetical protein DOTSEDRAFT_19743 [Dothistroma septosporum NZE10]|uniref:Uncharacterized protein n=1 Tax=Dothistroma septosporum (strain NZE10 / CBS 128990) TaxID=675120 RepID=N1Q206_DOTSN|nr:hypothetical protein DOTSEDRAFT_19743 [Dothistroma septosporum NZE10]
MESQPHDFVTLPIIVPDWDAATKTKSQLQVPATEIARSHAAALPTQADIGLIESFDIIWSRISDAMKAKVREAANEVLRRTGDSFLIQQEMSLQYDNDARLLD